MQHVAGNLNVSIRWNFRIEIENERVRKRKRGKGRSNLVAESKLKRFFVNVKRNLTF